MKSNFFSILALLCMSTFIMPLHISMSQEEKGEQKKELQFTFHLNPNELILKPSIIVKSDSPHAKLSQLSFSHVATKQFLPDFKDSKEVFNQNFTINTLATCQISDQVKTKIYISYIALPQTKTEEKIFEIIWNTNKLKTKPSHNSPSQIYQHSSSQPKKSYVESFQNMIKTTTNPWARILFIFLLGLLLSLTPCIYPMIPITIGILHRQNKQSVLYNFLGSACYAAGLSITFACMGLLAALAGASFGNLLSQPLFVILLTIFIGFMSLTMIGIVDMPIPSFMKNNAVVNSSYGPFLSAFLFGLLSGTIASPCVSPGLALVLTIVATIGDIFTGFLLLFAFGIGMSIPLIIIGTFSTSLNMLPQAGQWMVEIKKALGFVMLATCFYYLGNILPSSSMIWLFAGYLLFAAFFYILDAQKSFDQQSKTVKSFIGIVLLATSMVIGYRAYDNNSLSKVSSEQGVIWAENYEQGLQEAKNAHKLLLLDFWANHCTICKAIEKKIFYKQIVAQELHGDITFVKVDCSSSHNHEASNLKHKFNVIGQPTILVINPEDETIIKQWSSEPYNMTPKEFIQRIKELKQ